MASAADPVAAIPAPKVDEEDDERGCKERVLQKYFLQEWAVVRSLLDRIISNSGVSDPADINSIRSIMDKYQQEGQLLEPYLESIVSPLMLLVRARTAQFGTFPVESLEVIKPLCIIIYTLVTVCGYKSVIKFFPHQVSDLEHTFTLLEHCHDATSRSSLRQESTGEMETKCITLLWLYILVLIPFDLYSVDTSIINSNPASGAGPSPLVIRVLEISKGYLSISGPMRRISALLLSRLLTRPDMPIAFNSFIEWAHVVLSSIKDDGMDHFRLLGALEALSSIFKVGNRKLLSEVVDIIWSDIANVMKSTSAARSSLIRKFVVKLSQRIGLICLPHRSPTWRYVGKDSFLKDNIFRKLTDEFRSSEHLKNAIYDNVSSDSSGLEEEEMNIPEIMEEIIELLLTGLADSDTVVRWSAAKGIGRITSHLTSTLSEDVLSSVLELFVPGKSDCSWHGGCLALAELARRGLLLPASFSRVVPLIVKALHYDIRRGPHSIGSHVRDASAYVCWAFGRAYSLSDMKNILHQVAPHLLAVACYDREVNCRRAASAAFQENVGRQGTFPNAIEIVNSADYFSLSSRTNSYLHVAVLIAQYEHYLHPFAEELLRHKISHWDKSIRELASEGLSAIAKYDLEYFGTYVLENLIPGTLSPDLCTRHGSTLAVGELVLALHNYGFNFSVEKQESLSGIVSAIEKAHLYRGKGGEIMRSSVSRFIECLSLSNISVNDGIRQNLLNTLIENLRHPIGEIQQVAVDALKFFIPAYFVPSKSASDIISKYLELLDDRNVTARRGSALAVGVLALDFLTVRWKEIIAKLCRSCTYEDKPDDPDAEARVNSVRGLVLVCETLAQSFIDHNHKEVINLFLLIKDEVMPSLFKALDDYAVDNRGDVGSWVREAAIVGLEKCTYILCKVDSLSSINSLAGQQTSELPVNVMTTTHSACPLLDASFATTLIAGIGKQAVEKLDKIREVAARTLQRILHNKQHFLPAIPHRESLELIIPNTADLQWAAPLVSYSHFIQFLKLSCYSRYILSGLVISIGGLQESLRKVCLTTLLNYLKVSEDEMDEEYRTKECMLASDILWILKEYRKCDRVIIPTFKTVEALLGKKVFMNEEEHALQFAKGVLKSLVIELKGSKGFMKLCAGISILGYYSSYSKPISSHAFCQLNMFLGHRYPKIRKVAADQVYLVLLQTEDLLLEDKLEKALEILTETCWDGDIEEASSAKLGLFEMAGFSYNSATTANPESAKVVHTAAAGDENSSYSSLVGSTGF